MELPDPTYPIINEFHKWERMDGLGISFETKTLGFENYFHIMIFYTAK